MANKNSFKNSTDENINAPEHAQYPDPEPTHDYEGENMHKCQTEEEDFMVALIEYIENYEDDIKALHDLIPENTPLPSP